MPARGQVSIRASVQRHDLAQHEHECLRPAVASRVKGCREEGEARSSSPSCAAALRWAAPALHSTAARPAGGRTKAQSLAAGLSSPRCARDLTRLAGSKGSLATGPLMKGPTPLYMTAM